jgi:hypothetical protein
MKLYLVYLVLLSCIAHRAATISPVRPNVLHGTSLGLQMGTHVEQQLRLDKKPRRTTLVLYVFSNTDSQYRTNLDIFIRNGVSRDETAEYIIVVQMNSKADLTMLPKLPAHARYVKHINECYDW